MAEEEEKVSQAMNEREQVRIHDGISRECWAGALMEVRSLFGLNSAV